MKHIDLFATLSDDIVYSYRKSYEDIARGFKLLHLIEDIDYYYETI